MADTKISALPSATTPLTGTEVLPLVQAGGNVKVAVSDLTAGRAVSALSFAGPLNGTVGATTPTTGAFTTLSASGRFEESADIRFMNEGFGIVNANNSARIMTFNNTSITTNVGIAVTGTLSTTGNVTLGSVPASNTHTVNGITTVNFDVNGVGKVVLNNQNIGASSSSALVFGDTGTERWKWASYRDGTGQIRLSAVGGSDILTISSTGLAVTGTLSSTLGATIQGLTVGRGAGAVATNTAVGSGALAANTTGIRNTAIGSTALPSVTVGNGNVAVGFQAGNVILGADDNVAIGNFTLNATTSGSFNTAVGSSALAANTTASNNTAVGYQASYSNITGTATTALGYQALYNNTAGYNTAVGFGAGRSNSASLNNAFFGDFAGYYSTGNNVAFLGSGAGYQNTGSNNIAVGYAALAASGSGANNTALN
jgi:hypothetical protein